MSQLQHTSEIDLAEPKGCLQLPFLVPRFYSLGSNYDNSIPDQVEHLVNPHDVEREAVKQPQPDLWPLRDVHRAT